MMVIITYDVNTEDACGRARLRKIARQCVKNSVFECLLDAAQCKRLQHELLNIMDRGKDSLRFYYLGNQYRTKIEHFGVQTAYEPEGPLMI